MRWMLLGAILALLIPEPLAATQEQTGEPAATDFVIGLNAFNRQTLAALEQQPTRRVIILPFTDIDGDANRVALYITEQLITAIAATRQYELVDSGPLAEIARKNDLSPLELGTSAAYMQASSQLANTSVVVGTITFLQTRVGVMARVLHGESGRIIGGAQVYLKSGEEIYALLGTTPAQAGMKVTPRADTTPETQRPVGAGAQEAVAEEPKAQEGAAERAVRPASLEGRNDSSLYNEGREHYARRRFDDAIRVFQHLISTSPDSPLADNALYWSGECHFAKKRWQEALERFNGVLKDYPFGNKVPAAMLKIGYTQEKLGQLQEATAALERLIGRFPQSYESELGRRKLQMLRAALQE